MHITLYRGKNPDEEWFDRWCQVYINSCVKSEIETRSILTDQDISRLQQVKSLKVRARSAEWNERRGQLIDALLKFGATSIFFEVLVKQRPKLLAELLRYLPRDIVKRWIEHGGGDLIYLTYNVELCVSLVMLLFDYGANYQAKNAKGIEMLSNCKGPHSPKNSPTICCVFAKVHAGQRDILRFAHCDLDDFLACVHARNAQGQTILQVALHRGYLHCVESIVSGIIHWIPKSYVLEPSETMTYDQLIDATQLRLNELKKGLERLIDQGNEENIVEMTLPIFETAGQVLKLWQEYEAGMDLFYGQIHLRIVEETLEALGFDVDCLPAPSFSEERAAGYYANWRKNNEGVSAKAIVVKVVQVAIPTPIEAFLAAIYGAKLYEAAERGDYVAAAEYIKNGAMVNLAVRRTGKKDETLLQKMVCRGDEAIAKLLLDSKAKPRIEHTRKTLLHIAVKRGLIGAIESLLRNFDKVEINEYVNKRVWLGETSLRLAANASRFDIVKCLLKYQANYNEGKNYVVYDDSIARHCRDPTIRQFFQLIDRLFASASNGDVECLRLLRDLPHDELIAACNACDDEGYNLAQRARLNKHSYIATEIYRLMLACTNDKTIYS